MEKSRERLKICRRCGGRRVQNGVCGRCGHVVKVDKAKPLAKKTRRKSQ